MTPQPGMTQTLATNIERLADRRRREEADASATNRLAGRITAFTGSMLFVGLHALLFGAWIAWNLLGSPKFDPSFVVLAMIASVEAIFLSTFVLISQNRQAAVSDHRADLDLHISLLTEHELSKLAELVARIAEKVGVDPMSNDLAEIREDVDPERVLDALEKQEG
ncbi:DUF1003 domain-containing protein [Sphingomonas sp.]|uniref:DUF1003 domain-containing protein n=1 Tax=Sphingomonas sp. TaxID=28214 RepID=UPI003B0079E2